MKNYSLIKAFIVFVIPSALIACASETSTKEKDESIVAENTTGFDSTVDGRKTSLYNLTNGKGLSMAMTNYGGRIVSLSLNDKNGKPTDIIVGPGTLESFIGSSEPYFGATIGRVGNRIAHGKFKLDTTTYTLFTNNGPNTLHGGKKGYQGVIWDAKQNGDSSLVLKYRSIDREEGFPGNLDVTVTYTLTAENALDIRYEAVTDIKTVVNLTNHAFFNLNGEGSGTINNHQLYVNADKYTPVDSTLIPLGKIVLVKGTPFDFTKATAIGARVDTANEQLKFGKGYDHNYVLNKPAKWSKAAEITGDLSGITMEVWTEEPGLQFYGGNFMQAKNKMKSGKPDDFRTAFCLETQHYPDAPNQPSFPSIVLKPGDKYSTHSVYKFKLNN